MPNTPTYHSSVRRSLGAAAQKNRKWQRQVSRQQWQHGAPVGWLCAAFVSTMAGAALANANPMGLLGRGYDRELGTLRQPCVRGVVNTRGIHEAYFEQTIDDRFSSELEQTSGFFKAKVNILIASAKARGSYFAKNAKSDRSLTATTAFRVKYGAAVLDNAYPSNDARLALRNGTNALQRACGDTFVQRVDLGAGLFINATLHFANEEEAERFKLTVTAKALGGLVKKKKTWKKETASFSDTAVIQIDAYQEGGTPDRLNELLAEAPNQGACRMDSPEPCIDLLNRLFEYARADSGFASQFRDEGGTLLIDRAVPLKVHTERYDRAMMRDYQAKIVPRTVRPALADLFERVAAEIASQYAVLGRLEVLARLNDAEARRQELSAATQTCQHNIANLRKAQSECEVAQARGVCERAVQSAVSSLGAVSSGTLALDRSQDPRPSGY